MWGLVRSSWCRLLCTRLAVLPACLQVVNALLSLAGRRPELRVRGLEDPDNDDGPYRRELLAGEGEPDAG